MSGAVLTEDLLTQMGRSGQVPLFVRLLAIAATRANSEGEAWFDNEKELRWLLQHPSENEPRSEVSVLRAITRAQDERLLAHGSTLTCLRLPNHRVRAVRTAVV